MCSVKEVLRMNYNKVTANCKIAVFLIWLFHSGIGYISDRTLFLQWGGGGGLGNE